MNGQKIGEAYGVFKQSFVVDLTCRRPPIKRFAFISVLHYDGGQEAYRSGSTAARRKLNGIGFKIAS